MCKVAVKYVLRLDCGGSGGKLLNIRIYVKQNSQPAHLQNLLPSRERFYGLIFFLDLN